MRAHSFWCYHMCEIIIKYNCNESNSESPLFCEKRHLFLAPGEMQMMVNSDRRGWTQAANYPCPANELRVRGRILTRE